MLFFVSTLYALNDCASCNLTALTWNSWLLGFTMVLCPLWFNPFVFDLDKARSAPRALLAQAQGAHKRMAWPGDAMT
jgi:hypothetical protein